MDQLPQANTPNTQVNDVWSTLNHGIDAIASFTKAFGNAPQTQAAPTGKMSGTSWNPFPGSQGAYPQAEGKTNYASIGDALFGTPIALIIVVVIAAFFLLRR